MDGGRRAPPETGDLISLLRGMVGAQANAIGGLASMANMSLTFALGKSDDIQKNLQH
jgi:hypothetical protein